MGKTTPTLPPSHTTNTKNLEGKGPFARKVYVSVGAGKAVQGEEKRPHIILSALTYSKNEKNRIVA